MPRYAHKSTERLRAALASGELARLIGEGSTGEALAKKYSVSRPTAYKYLRQAGLDIEPFQSPREGPHRPTYLRAWREANDLSLAQMAEAIKKLRGGGTTAGYISKIELGQQEYRQGFLEAFAEICGCTPAELLASEPPDPDQVWATLSRRDKARALRLAGPFAGNAPEARNEAIIKAAAAGDALASIGRRYGISRQRVEQIVKHQKP
jgi:transcriptional regulator with XRE-family HTH domain